MTHRNCETMAYNEMYHQDLAIDLMAFVLKDDAAGAKRLLAGIRQQEKKMIYAQCQKDFAPLFYPVKSGNKDLMEFLVRDCQANVEQSDKSILYSFGTLSSGDTVMVGSRI